MAQENEKISLDWLYFKCRDAGKTDKEFIEAARFGAKALIQRLCSDNPHKPSARFESNNWATIWRSPEERPREESIIVLRNAVMLTYALYKAGYCYYDGELISLKCFSGKWCYKADLWGLDEDDPMYYKQ